MKKTTLFLLLIGFQQLMAQHSTEPYSVSRFADVKINTVRAETSGGNITVGSEPGNPRVEVYVQASNSRDRNLPKEALKERLDRFYELSVSYSNGTISAIAKPRAGIRDWNNGVSVSFRIIVPKNVSTNLNTSGGNITLSDLSGTQSFRTSGGNLSLRALSGRIEGRTSGGNISISDSKDMISLNTSGGNIDADNCGGNLELNTSGGNIRLNTLKGTINATTSGGSVRGEQVTGELLAHTSGGNIDLHAITGGLDASTSGGSIDVRFTDITGPVKLGNSGGNIRIQLPRNKGLNLSVSADDIRAELQGFKGDKDKEHIEGTVNGGGQSVRVRAGSGSVTITMN